METSSRTEADYREAIARVVRYVQFGLDEILTPRELATVAGFSPHHFHRIFRAVTGESVMDFVRRLRLERAAHRLRNSDGQVAEIAFDATYGSQEAFARAFQTYFGMAPSEYRQTRLAHQIPCTSGVHYEPSGFTAIGRAVDAAVAGPGDLCEYCRRQLDSEVESIAAILSGFSSFVFPHGIPEALMTEVQTDIDREIEDLQKEVDAARQRLNEVRRRRPREAVADYTLADSDGSQVRLSELFGDKDDLIVIHNMGTGCVYCTMWADGFNGIAPHLADRAAFVVCSPDKPEVQKRFAEKRNWRFRMVSAHGTQFFQEMGFWDNGPWPGVSTFHREPDGSIVRVGKSIFDAGDDYCAVWHLLDLLDQGTNGWEPKYEYGKAES